MISASTRGIVMQISPRRSDEGWGVVLKDGRLATLRFDRDVEGDMNPGWICHQVTALVDGEHAGYIRVTFLERGRFERAFPTLHAHHDRFGGGAPAGSAPHAPLAPAVEGFLTALARRRISPEAVQRRQFEALTQNFGKHLAENWLLFVDRPRVDFARTYAEGDRHYNHLPFRCNRQHISRPAVDFRRLGVGTAMYQVAAAELSTLGYARFYRAQHPAPEAAAVWRSMQATGLPILEERGPPGGQWGTRLAFDCHEMARRLDARPTEEPRLPAAHLGA